MTPDSYFSQFWKGNEKVYGLVESLQLAKAETANESTAGITAGRFYYPPHLHPSNALAGIEEGVLLKVSYTQLHLNVDMQTVCCPIKRWHALWS